MNLKSFFRDLFVAETECTLSFAVIGTLFARNATISYTYFFIPIVFGIICMIPCIPVYVKENMTIPQIIIQRLVELIVLEAVFIWSANLLAGSFLGRTGLIATGFCTMLFDISSYFIMYKMEKAESDRLNKKLKELAERTTEQKEESPVSKIDVIGEHDSHIQLPLGDILYFEADSEQVFSYTDKEIYQVKMRLYQVESISRTAGIIRVSKSHLVNLHKIQSVRTALNSRLYAKMPNGEEVLVSRKYAPELKHAMA